MADLFGSIASGSTRVSLEWLAQVFNKEGEGLSQTALNEIKRLNLDIQVDPKTREVVSTLPGNAKK